MKKSDSIASLAKALSEAQAEMPVVKFDAQNPFLKNQYATLGAIIDASQPILAKHGLSVVQMPITEGNRVGVETILAHSSGEWIANTYSIEAGESKGMSHAQIAGSILTYLSRYALRGVLKIYADEDNDANSPSPTTPPSTRPAVQPAVVKPTPAAKPAASVKPTAELRSIMISRLLGIATPKEIQEFAVKSGIILPTEQADTDWPLEKVPTNGDDFTKLKAKLQAFLDGEFANDVQP